MAQYPVMPALNSRGNSYMGAYQVGSGSVLMQATGPCRIVSVCGFIPTPAQEESAVSASVHAVPPHH
jgi:hypothetical protein